MEAIRACSGPSKLLVVIVCSASSIPQSVWLDRVRLRSYSGTIAQQNSPKIGLDSLGFVADPQDTSATTLQGVWRRNDL